ncbi:hemerythrin superfamily protein [Azospirillum agricola]|uniref:hemerythrin domain-containing protein n=1 Tax=Azospirillum agricola TaxID=1720247 RepID=UPI001AE5F3D2|nr:hemerythrin domain-containing protein [Azospirillum agricola]MBP2230466.1 hemerythrin superfamily protein [Azospirillum agricola]
MARSDGWLSMQGMAAFAGGAALAVIASRLLPPLVAQVAGSARARAGRDPFDALADDHRRILALLSEMVRTPIDATVRRTQLLLRLKRRLAAHAVAEEDVVYPMLRDDAHLEEDARRLYGDHAEMKMHLFALERMAKDDPRWLAVAHELKHVVTEHIRQEETVDFPRLRHALDERAVVSLSGNVAREKALLL